MSKKLALVMLAIKLILAGINSKNAVNRIAKKNDLSFSAIWQELPDVFK